MVFLNFGIFIKIDRLTHGAKTHETHASGAIIVATVIRQGTLTLWCQNSRNGTLIIDASMIRVLIIDATVLIFRVGGGGGAGGGGGESLVTSSQHFV